MANFDVMVVGAGIAGAASAALLGQGGFRVLLLEKKHFPRQKVCGEGLMPAANLFLNKLGMSPDAWQDQARPFFGIHFHLTAGHSLELDFREFGESVAGCVVPRRILDTRLAHFAARQRGVHFREGFQVQSASLARGRVEVTGLQAGRAQTHTARVLIGADGIRSRFHHGFGIRRRRRRLLRFALRTLYEDLEGAREVIEVYCRPQGEAYVAPMRNGCARITLLLYGPLRHSPQAELSELYYQSLKGFPRLMERLRIPYPRRRVEATGPVSLQISRGHARRLLLIGDAAGAVDPITGQGMTLALKDAALASQILKDRLPHDRLSQSDLSEYTKRRERYFGPSFQLANFLLSAVRHPLLARRALRAVSRNRALRRRLITLATGFSETRGFTRWDQLHLLLGI